MSKHPIVHVELAVNDRKEASKFYGDIFGWEFENFDDMNYTTFSTGEGVAGGLNPISENYPAGTVTFYIQTDDVTATLKKIEAAGGKAVVPETEIPGTGHFGFFKDPNGNLVGLMKWAQQG